MKQFYHLLIILLLLNSCYKPVYTEYFQEENYTEFTTHEILIEIPSDRILKIFASRRCPGRTICEAEEIKLRLSLNTKFSFLEGKDFSILSNDEEIDLNQRRYFFDYNSGATYSDGTSGFAIEQWVVWVDSKNFKKIIQNKDNKLKIGDYTFALPSLELKKWKILISKPLLLETMEEEDQRTYGTYTEPPVSETEVREKFEKKAYIEAEETTWKMVKDSENPDDLRFFLEQYPNSPYAAPARLKLKQLEREKN